MSTSQGNYRCSLPFLLLVPKNMRTDPFSPSLCPQPLPLPPLSQQFITIALATHMTIVCSTTIFSTALHAARGENELGWAKPYLSLV